MILFKRKKRVLLGIDLAPFVDMVFTLLIFFIITATFMKAAINLKLPVLAGGVGQDLSRTVVAVDRAERMMLNGTPIAFSDLGAALHRTSKQASVLFQCDESVRYGLIVKVMEQLKAAGVKDISLQHDVERGPVK